MSYQNLEKVGPVIAAPRPGYAAPIAALNLARPEASAIIPGRTSDASPPAYSSPSPTTPHPLNPPMTPIQPAFARPPKTTNISFADSKPIMRSNTEETLLPKRGEKGDDFWRRFSIVAKEENRRKPSPWLKKTQNGSTRLSRWVWVIGLVLLLLIGAACGLGWYISHDSPDHQQPAALGGTGTNKGAVDGAKASTAPAVTGSTTTAAKVTPTFTVDRRAAVPVATPDPLPAYPQYAKRARIGMVRHRIGHNTNQHGH